MPNPDDLSTTAEAAERLNTSRRNVQSYVKKRQLPAEKHGRDWLIPAAALIGFVPPPVGPPRKKKERQK